MAWRAGAARLGLGEEGKRRWRRREGGRQAGEGKS